MIRMQDVGELGYGGLVTLSEWWDDKRIAEGKITKKDIFKKASLYTYLLPGALCTLTSAFGFWRQISPWDEHISHGFIYDFPRFIKNMVNTMGEGTERRRNPGSSDAVKEAQRILDENRRLAKQLNRGARETGRYPADAYNKEFQGIHLVG